MSSCLAVLLLSVGYPLWNELWHYQAHGVVDARIVQLAARPRRVSRQCMCVKARKCEWQTCW